MHRTLTVWSPALKLFVGTFAHIVHRTASAAALSVILCAHAAASTAYTNIPFPSPAPGAPNAACVLDLFVPSDGPHADKPTIILVHGGGYSSGDKSDYDPMCAALADLGYSAITMNYRLVTPAMVALNIGTFPQPTCDVLNAVNWVRTSGQDYGISDRVVLGGFSAGATIALDAAMGAGDPRFNVLPPGGARGYVIDGTIGGFGRYDLAWNLQNFGLPGYVNSYLGLGAADGFANAALPMFPNAAAIYALASAATLVDNCSPPTVLYHGDADGIVPMGNSVRLQQALTAAGVPVQLHIISGGPHDLPVFGPTLAAQVQTIAAAADWVIQQGQSQCGRTSTPPDPTGPCCAASGACAISTSLNCAGLWTADGSCTPNLCPAPPPRGVCCASSGACAIVFLSACNGVWSAQGGCMPNLCPSSAQPGACCTGAICIIRPHDSCDTPGQNFIGVGQSCNAPGNHAAPCCAGDFNQDGTIAVTDIFAFLGAWFAGDPRCILPNALGVTLPFSGPTVMDIFQFLAAWFNGC